MSDDYDIGPMPDVDYLWTTAQMTRQVASGHRQVADNEKYVMPTETRQKLRQLAYVLEEAAREAECRS